LDDIAFEAKISPKLRIYEELVFNACWEFFEERGMPSLGTGFKRLLKGRSKEKRRATRSSDRANAWVRPDRSFAVRPCKIIDKSSTGVRLSVERAEGLSGDFILMASRTDYSGRRMRIRWRRGSEVGAEII
jgi:hypothetical protein